MRLLALTALLAVHPVTFTQPTSLAVEPAGTILVVENNPGRVLRLDPRSGKVTVVVRTLQQPYAITRADGGALFVSAGHAVLRIDGGVRTAYTSPVGVGPLAAGRDGSVYWATDAALYRNGKRIAPKASLAGPHGLTVAHDGALLVSDTGHDRVLRVARDRVSVFARVASPRGIDVLANGSVEVIDSVARTLVRLGPTGRRLGTVGPFDGDPYAVSGRYVLQAGQVGTILHVRGTTFVPVSR